MSDDVPESSSSSSKNIQWMYEGTKSMVNREDYLLGKKIDKNFEMFSDVVVKDREEEQRDDFFRKSLLQQPAASSAAAASASQQHSKVSALDTRVVRTEDPLVALKFQEEQRKRQLLDNPLLKLKAQRVLRKAFEKELKKKGKKHKKEKRKRKESSTSSDEDDNEREEERKKRSKISGGRDEHRLSRSGARRSRSKDRSPRSGRRSGSRDRSRSGRGGRSRSGDRSGRGGRSRSGDRSRSGRRRRSGSRTDHHQHHHRKISTTSEDRKKEQRNHERDEQPNKAENGSNTLEAAAKIKTIETTVTVKATAKKLTPEELERRRQAMLENATWRDEMRERNLKEAAEKLQKEREEQSGAKGPSFIRPLIDSATESSTLEKRLQSNRMNIQRQHDHMDKSFARK